MSCEKAAVLLSIALLLASKASAQLGKPSHAVLPSVPVHVYGNTTEVESMALSGNNLWVATRGGLERYDTHSLGRTAYFSTLDGLPSLFVKSVRVGLDGEVTVESGEHKCTLDRSMGRFKCYLRGSQAVQAGAMPRFDNARIEGVPVTAHVKEKSEEYFGTAGLGVWRLERNHWRRLTPHGQLCSNHVVAMAEYRGSTWFASFDHGLCRLDGEGFVRASLATAFLNDVIGTDQGLFVASSEGLYHSVDGVHFERDDRVTEGSVNDLAYDAKRGILYATCTNSLWRVPLAGHGRRVLAYYQPGGSRSLQAVDVGPDGEVWLASEDRGVMRKSGTRKFEVYDRLAGLPSSWAVDVLAKGGKRALAASLDQGVIELGGTDPPRALPTPDPWMLFLGRDAGSPVGIFVGTQGGAMLIEAGGKVQTFTGLPDPRVHAIARLSSGLWVATENGLARY